MKEEIQKILDRNFTRGDNAKALKELLILFDVSNSVCVLDKCDCGFNHYDEKSGNVVHLYCCIKQNDH